MTSVVIPVFNKFELTERCLLSICDHSKVVTEVFVIDNGSTDATSSRLQEFEEKFQARGIRFTAIRNNENRGFGRACNQGIRLCTGDFVVVLNNDTWVMPAWDQVLAEVLQKESLDLVGPFFDERPEPVDLLARSQLYLKQNSAKLRKHFVPILLFFKKSAIAKLQFESGGIFDERFFVTYEDTDLLFRMRKLGLTYAQTSLCYIWHHSMGTREAPGLLPPGYETEGLSLFIEKWGFDPRPLEHTFFQRLKRRYRKARAAKGLF